MGGHSQQGGNRKRHSGKQRNSTRQDENTTPNETGLGRIFRFFHLPKERALQFLICCLVIPLLASLTYYFTSTGQGVSDQASHQPEGIGTHPPKPKKEWPPKQVVIYKNGDHKNGVVVILSEDVCGAHIQEDFATSVSYHLYWRDPTANPCAAAAAGAGADAASAVPPWATATCRLFDGSGRPVRTCAAAAQAAGRGSLGPQAGAGAGAAGAGPALYLVPPGREFLWPTIDIGHKTVISHIVPPAGAPIAVETLAHAPRLFRVSNFFSEAEAAALTRQVAPGNEARNQFTLRLGGPVITLANGTTIDLKRTSESGFDVASKTAIDLKQRAFKLLGIERYDETWADGVQVLRYNKSAAYNKHFDYVDPQVDPNHNLDSKNGGTNRFATILLYLSDVPLGGETFFSDVQGVADWPPDEEYAALWGEVQARGAEWGLAPGSWQEAMVLHCRSRLAVSPRRGQALMFYNQLPDGSLDTRSMHGGCPVLEGEKWAANLWVWNGPRMGY